MRRLPNWLGRVITRRLPWRLKLSNGRVAQVLTNPVPYHCPSTGPQFCRSEVTQRDWLSAQGLPRLNGGVSCAQVSPGGSGDKHASGPLLEAEFSSHGYENKVPVSHWLSEGHTPLPEAACVPATWPLHLQDHESSSCLNSDIWVRLEKTLHLKDSGPPR